MNLGSAGMPSDGLLAICGSFATCGGLASPINTSNALCFAYELIRQSSSLICLNLDDWFPTKTIPGLLDSIIVDSSQNLQYGTAESCIDGRTHNSFLRILRSLTIHYDYKAQIIDALANESICTDPEINIVVATIVQNGAEDICRCSHDVAIVKWRPTFPKRDSFIRQDFPTLATLALKRRGRGPEPSL